MELVRKLDEHGKGAWMGLMVLSFIFFWPAGLAILAYMIWSGRMGKWKHGCGRWYDFSSHSGRHKNKTSSTGNHAFDDYREETLRRLEDEQIEFESFLERLRHAKNKAEFDDFMKERRDKPKDAPTFDNEAPQAGA
jgi:hypothetical protein